MNPLTPAAVLYGAHDVYAARGRTVDNYQQPDDGRVCVLAALAIAAGLPADAFEDVADLPVVSFVHAIVMWAARDLLDQVDPATDGRSLAALDVQDRLTAWHDRVSQADVLAALTQTARVALGGAA